MKLKSEVWSVSFVQGEDAEINIPFTISSAKHWASQAACVNEGNAKDAD